ncbi:hypothetical protein GCM10010170_104630 [Dactylosporangium salmoneum]|uniref:Uncharacterized protein n=1 Tax=Dactylosporangium salmoneum TaxID=53361 RepID=A0ABN3I1Q4_9ACTN
MQQPSAAPANRADLGPILRDAQAEEDMFQLALTAGPDSSESSSHVCPTDKTFRA